MGTTTNHSLRYPENVNSVAVPADIKKLADDVDAKLISSAGGTVSGNVAFTGITTVQTPTANNHAATKQYVDNAAAIPDGSITGAKIANDTVTATNIAPDAVGSSELANNAVDTLSIQNDAVTSAKIAAGQVGTSELAPSSVDTLALQNSSVTAAKIADDTITATQIAPNAVGSSELADNAVDTAALQDSAVTSAKIGALTTKGDLLARDGSGAVRLPVGTDGQVLVADAAASAGVKWSPSPIASNGAVHLSGTGAPEGVVTAAPGSTWLQTDSTTDVKGWIRWIKATGTGSTGWVAGAEADTGWRRVESLIDSDWAASPGGLTLRRQGGRVTLRLNPISRVTASGNRSDIAAGTFIVTPSGFAQSGYVSVGVATVNGIPDGHISALAGSGQIGIVCPSGTWTADQVVWGEASYTTADPWPASLPGTAV